MKYQTWLNAFFEACNADMAIPYPWSRDEFPTINLRAFYEQGFAPERAATLCKAINLFTKPQFFGRQREPIRLKLTGKA